MPTLEWRRPENPKQPKGRTFPLQEQAPVTPASYVLLQGRGYAGPSDFYLYHSYMRAIKAALKANGLPENHVHNKAYHAKLLPGSHDTIRTELFQAYPLHDRPRRNQAIGFKAVGNDWSDVITFAGERAYFKRLRKVRLDGGAAGFRGGFELVLAAPTDPDLEIDLLLPWTNGENAISSGPQTVDGLLQTEALGAAADLGIDPDELWKTIHLSLSSFLPSQQPEDWEIFAPQATGVHLEEDEEKAIEVEFNCPTDGSCMFALKAHDISDSDEPVDDNGYFVSDPIAVVVEQGEVSILFAGEDYELEVVGMQQEMPAN